MSYAVVFTSPWTLLGLSLGDTPALVGAAVTHGLFDPMGPSIGVSVCFACLEFKIILLFKRKR